MIWLYIIIFSLFSLICMFGFWVRWQWNKNYQEKKVFFPVEEISVIIPFRNESENLPKLIASLNALQFFPREIIWVNDHSEDDFASCFESLSVPFRSSLIHLAPGDEGKKTAIRAGISDAQGKYILTWDADITIRKNYFRQLAKTPLTEFLVLPVSMPGKTLSQVFFELDYQYLNALNVAVSGHMRPIVASGANLLFHKDTFEEVDSYDEHAEVASGDDVFLLQDFKRHRKDIELALHPDLQVRTEAPQTWDAFFQQRLRWIGKSRKVGDRVAAYLGGIGMFYHVGFWLMFFTGAPWSHLLALTIVKIFLDALLLLPYLLILKRPWIGLFLPFFSLLYPIYMLMILVMTMFYEPEWKGRTLV